MEPQVVAHVVEFRIPADKPAMVIVASKGEREADGVRVMVASRRESVSVTTILGTERTVTVVVLAIPSPLPTATAMGERAVLSLVVVAVGVSMTQNRPLSIPRRCKT